jgi:Fungal N-terminal domain of STAND proteins
LVTGTHSRAFRAHYFPISALAIHHTRQILVEDTGLSESIMDPITIAGLAGIAAQFSQLAIHALAAIHQYIKDVRNVPREARELYREVEIMKDFMDELEATIMPTPEDPSLRTAANSAVTVLQEILGKLKKRSGSSRTAAFGRLKWPFIKEDTNRHIQQLQRHKHTLSIIILPHIYNKVEEVCQLVAKMKPCEQCIYSQISCVSN